MRNPRTTIKSCSAHCNWKKPVCSIRDQVQPKINFFFFFKKTTQVMSSSLLQKESPSPSRRPSLTQEAPTSCTLIYPSNHTASLNNCPEGLCTPGSVPRVLTALWSGALLPLPANPPHPPPAPFLQWVPPLLQPSNPGLSRASSHGAYPSRCHGEGLEGPI